MSGVPFVTFEIFGGNGTAWIKLIQGPDELTDDAKPVPLPQPLQPLFSWPPPNPVQSYGEELLRLLNGVGDANVRKAIEHAVTNDGTIYLKLKSADWESHAFEALCDNAKFFLLKPGRGMARMVDVARYRNWVPFALEPPVRIMAVLSAAGVKNGPQWKAFFEAAKKNADDTDGLPLQVKLLTGEEELADAIRKTAPTGDHFNVSVANIDDGHAETVVNEIRRFRPHILHFFCHGEIVNGAGVLQLSSINQHRKSLLHARPADGTQTSFKLDYSRFRGIVQSAYAEGWLWLVVMNACKLGASAANVSALAQKFALAGVPAAIGMSQEIDVNDASEFCAAFYPSLFIELASAQSKLATTADCELDWAKLLHGPRSRICDKRGGLASCNPQWTLPLLYVGVADFRLKKAAPRPPRRLWARPETSDLANEMREGALEQVANTAPREVVEELAKVESR